MVTPKTKGKTTMDDNLAHAMQDAIYRMWLDELNAVNDIGRADWHRRRIAAEEICDLVGVTGAIRAIALDGELRPPPAWPEVDCVPVGGGPGVITCEVRTQHTTAGKLGVVIGLRREGKSVFDPRQIQEAMDRGKFELRRIIDLQGT